jgi:glycosyltransferase involved in cell wall biosynthesis
MSTAQPVEIAFAIFQTGNRANGGVESVTQIIERARRVRPVVVTQLETPTTERWRRAGLEVHVRPAAFESWSAGATATRHIPANQAWMAELVRRRRFRVVHVNDITAFVNLGVGARLGGARLVLNVRDVKPADQPYTMKWRLAASMSDRVIALSAEMVDDLRARLCGDHLLFGAPALEHIYSVVDPESMRPPEDAERAALRARLGLPDDRFAIAYVAAFNPKKAQLAFLQRGLRSLVERVPSALVCFVGDFAPDRDPYARKCADAVASQGLEGHVRFVGFSTAVADWYRACDSVLLASRTEGLARCMIEGLACGTPIVSFDVCSAREILEGHRCGLVAPSGDYDGLAAAVARLAGDRTLAAQLGATGAEAARALFDPDEVVRRYEDAYLALAGGRDG